MLRILLVLAIALLVAPPVRAEQGEGWLFAPFDVRELDWNERQFLQAALAMRGYYRGMLDGHWGKSSEAALAAFARTEDRSAYVSGLDVGALILLTAGDFADNGWDYSHFPSLDLSFLVPKLRSSPPLASKSGQFVNFDHTGGTLGYSLTVGDDRQMQRLQDFAASAIAGDPEPYFLRKPRLLVSSGHTAQGKLLYARSDLRDGFWSTIMLSAERGDEPLVHMVAGSIRPGRADPLRLPDDGRLVAIVRATARALDQAAAQGDSALPPQSGRSDTAGSGSGFYVGTGGEVLSNAHVVKGCATLTVDGQPASLRAISAEFDLALVDTGRSREAVAAFAPDPAALNSDVTVVGYPLSGLLGGLNVTRGAVSGLSGIGGDPARMQISAPVQPGNSGGPVVDRTGAVVGVVVSKLDALRMADRIGDIPQNVNFAIRGEIAKLFLTANGVAPRVDAAPGKPLEPEELAARASAVTAYIECR